MASLVKMFFVSQTSNFSTDYHSKDWFWIDVQSHLAKISRVLFSILLIIISVKFIQNLFTIYLLINMNLQKTLISFCFKLFVPLNQYTAFMFFHVMWQHTCIKTVHYSDMANTVYPPHTHSDTEFTDSPRWSFLSDVWFFLPRVMRYWGVLKANRYNLQIPGGQQTQQKSA